MFVFNKFALATTFVVSSFVSVVHAGGGVTGGATEITQLLNNGQLLLQLSEAEAQTLNQVKQLMQMYQQAEREIMHLQQISSDVTKVAKIVKEGDLLRFKSALVRTERIHGNLENLHNRLSQRMQEAYQKGQTVEQYVASQGAAIQRGEVRAVARIEEEKSMINVLQADYENIQKLNNEIAYTNGTQQSLGLMNTQLNHALVSLNRLAAVMQANQDNVNKAQAETDENIRVKRESDFKEQLRDRDSAYKNYQFDGYDALSGRRLNERSNEIR